MISLPANRSTQGVATLTSDSMEKCVSQIPVLWPVVQSRVGFVRIAWSVLENSANVMNFSCP